MVRSKPRGRSTSAPAAEVEGISPRGIWLWVHEKEYYLSFEEYPWFRQATVGQIHDVQFLHGSHLRWPARRSAKAARRRTPASTGPA